MPATWTPFRRHDQAEAVRLVAAVASAGDTGAYGHGVEVVLESPHLHWWRRLFDHSERDQARIAITGPDGRAAYPIHVRLVTGFGAHAVRKVDRRAGWATSVTAMTAAPVGAGAGDAAPHPHVAGEAILMLKRGTALDFDAADAATEVVAGTVAALADLHPFSPDRGWRARVDRDVVRR
ncbi:MAG TPA: hypothetical protein VGJ28_15305 [Micromonosporaceae bacterium]